MSRRNLLLTGAVGALVTGGVTQANAVPAKYPERTELADVHSKELLKAVLRAPRAREIYAHDMEARKVRALKENSQEVQALLQRADGAKVVLGALESFDPVAFQAKSSFINQAQLLLEFDILCILALQPEMRTALSSRDMLRERLESYYETAATYTDAYGYDVRARIARMAIASGVRTSSGTRDGFTGRDGGALSSSSTPQALALVDFERAVGWGSGDMVPAATVYTPNGTAVTVVVRSELTQAQITANNNYVANNYPNADRMSNSSRKYNCHSYAWYQANSSNPYWMDSPQDDKYWNDGSWVVSSNFWAVGSRLSWRSDDHSGVVTTNTKIFSKWGQLPIMKHSMNYTPYDNSNVRGWYIRS